MKQVSKIIMISTIFFGFSSSAFANKGAEIFAQSCASCHGAAGDISKSPVAKILKPAVKDITLVSQTHTSKADAQKYIAQILNEGIKGSAMVAYPNIKGNDQKELIDYILTIQKKPIH